MARILIRDLSDETVRRLKDRARRHGRSLQEEVRLTFAQAAGTSFEKARQLTPQWHKRLVDREFPDSTRLLREDRER